MHKGYSRRDLWLWRVCVKCDTTIYNMTIVRERRRQQPLRLSLPPPAPLSERIKSGPVAMQATGPDSPDVGNLSDLEKLAVLGHGHGGTVYKVRHRRCGSEYALKVLRVSREDARQAAREAEILKRVNSEFVVRCYSMLEEDVGSAGGGDLCFVMEYMEGGSLGDLLRTRTRLGEEEISGVARRVLEGLRYLHGLSVVHRDIKPSNLLISCGGEVKIADFGVSRSSRVAVARERDSCMGTCAYMSPERIDPGRWDAEGEADGFAGDVWAVGVVVLECHLGRFPMVGAGQRPDWAAVVCAVSFGQTVELPDTASPELRSFLRRCLDKDWRKRGTVEELLGHPFVASNKSNCCLNPN